ncbi:hypothetical protein U1Q18_016583 [Sarracenia purpurea var. burkii]
MEQVLQSSPEIPVMEKINNNADFTKVMDGDLNLVRKDGKKEEDEMALEGEFVKVEKEPLDVKDGSLNAKIPPAENDKSSVIERSSSNSIASREFLETQEKAKELESELERVAGALKLSESANSKLNDELLVTKMKLEESGKNYEELKFGHRKLQEQIIETEERYQAQINALQESLQARDAKHKDLVGVKEAFDSVSLELESSSKKMQELEKELQTSAGEARKFEELHKQSGSHAESEAKRALEFERLFEMAKSSAKEMEGQMVSLQEELKGLYEKIAENQKVEEALRSTTGELAVVQGELELSKSQVLEMEQTLASKEARLHELTQEVDLRKESFDSVGLELERSRKKVQDLEQDLQTWAGEAHKFEELHKESGSHAESATKKALEFERLLEMEKLSAKEMEALIASLQEELKGLHEKIAENQKAEEALKTATAELSVVQGEVELSKSQVLEMEQRLASKEALLQELMQEVGLRKESFDSVSLELENSRKKMQELEQELQTSADEARKFEELHKESSSHVESVTQRALQFERLVEIEKLSVKEMEDQMASLQEELKGLNEKIAENENVAEALKSATAKLSAVQGELELSKSQVLETEKRLASKEALLHELTQELDLRKASESQVKEDISVLEKSLLSAKENLQVQGSELEEVNLKLKEEARSKELIEVELRKEAAKVSMIQEKLTNVTKEKEALEAAVADLTSNVAQMKEVCNDLEMKLQSSDENFGKADSLLSQALANSAELEQKLKSLEELHHESGYAATTAQNRNLELEDIIQASNAAAAEAKSQLREVEMRFIAAEQKNVELEQLLNLVELKSNDAERELRELSEKNSELSATLKQTEEEKKQLRDRIQDYEDKITQMESVLNESSLRNSQLELELKNVAEKCADHEGRASVTHQRSLELEDLIQVSHSKVEDAGKKVSEMELLLEADKYRIQELEEQISKLEKKCGDAEAESNKHFDKISKLEMELEAFQSKASSLEVALQTANEKEKELTECLNATTNEKKSLEDALRNSNEKLAEVETVLEVLRNELNLSQQKLESIEDDLKAAEMRENEVMKKLKSAEEQLEHQGRVLEKATSRSSELESLHESLTRDRDLKLQEAIANFTKRDSEAKSLDERLKLLQNQVKVYEEQIAEAAARSVSEKEELDHISTKLASSEMIIEELKRKISEAEDKSVQFFSENELLAETNKQLKTKVNELQESLNSAHSEKEITAQQLVSHMNTITELADQHSKASELQLIAEARISEAEREKQEALQKFNQRDLEAKDLTSKQNVLQTQIKMYEEQIREASRVTESQKIEVEQTLLKAKGLEEILEELQNKSGQIEKEREGLAESNSKLTREVATYESKLNDLHKKISATVAEKDEALDQLYSSKKQIEDLTEQLAIERQKQQSQRDADSQKDLEQEAALKHSFEELESKKKVVILLEKQVKELEQKLQLADIKSKEKGDGGSPAELKDEMVVKSRDIGSTNSTPSRRKSKKKLESTSAQAPSSEIHTQTTGVSTGMTFKFILGVAVVSVLIGIILGKRY